MKYVIAGVEEEFLPWLAGEVAREIQSIITSRDVVTGTEPHYRLLPTPTVKSSGVPSQSYPSTIHWRDYCD